MNIDELIAQGTLASSTPRLILWDVGDCDRKMPPLEKRTHAAGDLEGFKDLEARYRLPLRRFFKRRLRNSPDPDDLVQEVFLRLVRQGNAANIQFLDGYVFQVAANVLRDYARRWAVRAEEADHAQLDETELEGGFSPERVLLGKEALERLIGALQELPEKTAVIFSLYHFDSVPQVEIARRLGMPVSTVEKHMSRANAYLLERLGRADEIKD